ncbi:MAG: type IV secretory system conjugative DNA transfer family protein [Candidatus Dormibacteria bacterium]
MTDSSHRRPFAQIEVFTAGIAATWAALFAHLQGAARLGGGDPRTEFFDFPGQAWQSLAVDHGLRPWHWVGAATVSAPRFAAALAILVAISGGAVAGILRVLRATAVWQPTSPRSKHPASRWARRSDLRGLTTGESRGRLVLGRWKGHLVRAEGCASTLVFGPTQSGKSSAFCVPAALDWEGPLVMTSTKRDLVDVTAGHRQGKGPVFIYDPTASTGLPSSTWSPLAGCERRQVAVRRAAAMASALARGSEKGAAGGEWKHWEAASRRLLAVCLFAAASTGRDILAVRRWIDTANAEQGIDDAITEMIDSGTVSPRDIREVMDGLAAIENRPDTERQTVYSTTQQLLDVFQEEPVAISAETSTLDIDRILDEQGTLYLCAPVEEQRRVASLFSGLLMAVVDRVYERAQSAPTGRIPSALLLVLDEAANIAPLDELPQIASQGLSQGLSLVTVFQDLAQIEERYGEAKARTIVNNHRAKVALSGISDVGTCDYLGRLVGSEIAIETTFQERSRSYSYRPRPMMPPEVVRTIPRGEALVIYGNLPPFHVHQRPWFEDPGMMTQAAAPLVPVIAGSVPEK